VDAAGSVGEVHRRPGGPSAARVARPRRSRARLLRKRTLWCMQRKCDTCRVRAAAERPARSQKAGSAAPLARVLLGEGA
jgi:hypothetical protein